MTSYEYEEKQGEALVSVFLSEEAMKKLGELGVIDGMPRAEEIRRAADDELERVAAGEVTVEEVLAAGARDPKQTYHLASVRVSGGFKDKATQHGFVSEGQANPKTGPLIRAGVARRLQRCEQPDFQAELVAAKAAINSWADDYVIRMSA